VIRQNKIFLKGDSNVLEELISKPNRSAA
jgi:hypothetical protein